MRLVRWLVQDAIWLVTNRTEQELLLLLPSPKINNLIAGWLARALELHGSGIELFAFIFLGNHFHLLLRDTKGQLPKFMWYFQTNLAKEVNRELGRHGHVFAKRYDAELVGGEKDFLAVYAYVVGNAVRSGLVERAAQWPGLSSLRMAVSGKAERFEVFDRTGYHNATRRGQDADRARFSKQYVLRVTPPPMWSGYAQGRIGAEVEALVSVYDQEQKKLRRADGKGFMGVKRVMAQKPTDRPLESSFGVRAFVLCRDQAMRKEILASWRSLSGDYRAAFEGYRKASSAGRRRVMEWPRWTCPPSCMEPVGYTARAGGL